MRSQFTAQRFPVRMVLSSADGRSVVHVAVWCLRSTRGYGERAGPESIVGQHLAPGRETPYRRLYTSAPFQTTAITHMPVLPVASACREAGDSVPVCPARTASCLLFRLPKLRWGRIASGASRRTVARLADHRCKRRLALAERSGQTESHSQNQYLGEAANDPNTHLLDGSFSACSL